VAVVTRPDIDLTMSGWHLFVLRTALTIGLAEASFRLVEAPFRVGGVRAVVRAWGWPRLSRTTRARVAPAALAGAFVIAGSLISVFVYTTSPGAGRRAPIAQPVAVHQRGTKTGGAPAGAATRRRPSRPASRPSPLRSRSSVRSATR